MPDTQPGVLAAIVARNTEAIGILQIRTQALDRAVRALAALGMRAVAVLGRSSKNPEDLLEAAAINSEIERVVSELFPRAISHSSSQLPEQQASHPAGA